MHQGGWHGRDGAGERVARQVPDSAGGGGEGGKGELSRGLTVTGMVYPSTAPHEQALRSLNFYQQMIMTFYGLAFAPVPNFQTVDY